MMLLCYRNMREIPNPNFGGQSRLAGENEMYAYIGGRIYIGEFYVEMWAQIWGMYHSQLKLLGHKRMEFEGNLCNINMSKEPMCGNYKR